MRRLRQPAFVAPPPPPAAPLPDDPSARLEVFFEQVWRERMQDLPFVNPALRVEAVGFRTIAGDWLGAVVTPWFLNLFLLPGGGSMWRDLPAGEQGRFEFPAGGLDFIADHDPAPEAPLAAYLYCPLMHPVQHLPDQATARQAALDALAALLTPPPEAAPAAPAAPAPDAPRAGRRAFLRGRSGHSG